MLLKPNQTWKANQIKSLPSVQAIVTNQNEFLQFDFLVEEPIECFRAEIFENNSCNWEDSCVEIFLKNPTNPMEYYNFEVTSREFMLAAKGSNRNQREFLTSAEIDSVKRTKEIASVVGNLICWGMTVQIPASLFGLKTFNGISIEGNLYKCADKAKAPHYLSAFPIDTESPDFHRPEFFKTLV